MTRIFKAGSINKAVELAEQLRDSRFTTDPSAVSEGKDWHSQVHSRAAEEKADIAQAKADKDIFYPESHPVELHEFADRELHAVIGGRSHRIARF